MSVPVDLHARARSELRDDETVVRADDVILLHTSTTNVWPEPPVGKMGLGAGARAYMVVTSRRLLFLPMDSWRPLWRRLAGRIPVLRQVLAFPGGALGQPLSIEFATIARFHRWEPEFSGPPAFEVGYESWSFRLMVSQSIFKVASGEQMREHFRAVEAAWLAARGAMSEEGSG